jgi:acetyl-CoA carboxylase carboxyl transferase subunit alpha
MVPSQKIIQAFFKSLKGKDMSEKIVPLEFEKPIAELQEKIASLRTASSTGKVDLSEDIENLEAKCLKLKNEIYRKLTPWQRVQLARHPKRPYTNDYIKQIFTDFVELHGDRAFYDDQALVAGLGLLDGMPVAVLGQQKGRDIQENLARNFAMAHPEGYRKALRVMKLAEKFNRPIITFIDTPGAYPGIGAEERGQAEAIARNLREMASLTVPVISTVIGEGGSGGALGIGVANRVLMLENAYYSVISPEGCAAILFRDAAMAQEAATALKITAKDLKQLGIVDEIVQEPLGGAHIDPEMTAKNLKAAILRNLQELIKYSESEIVEDRYTRFRNLGVFVEKKPQEIKEPKISTNRRK